MLYMRLTLIKRLEPEHLGLRSKPTLSVAPKTSKLPRISVGIKATELDCRVPACGKAQSQDEHRPIGPTQLAAVEQTQMSQRAESIIVLLPQSLRPEGRRMGVIGEISTHNEVNIRITKWTQYAFQQPA